MPVYDITIKATVVKTIRVENCDTLEWAIEEAHSQFSVDSTDEPEKYTEECLEAKEVK